MMQRATRHVLNRTIRNRRMMTSWVEDMNKGLTEVDPEICDIIELEKHRQRSSLCLIGNVPFERETNWSKFITQTHTNIFCTQTFHTPRTSIFSGTELTLLHSFGEFYFASRIRRSRKCHVKQVLGGLSECEILWW